jgi:hypothetical protein
MVQVSGIHDGYSWNIRKREEKLPWAGEVWMGEWNTLKGTKIPASPSPLLIFCNNMLTAMLFHGQVALKMLPIAGEERIWSQLRSTKALSVRIPKSMPPFLFQTPCQNRQGES